MRSRALSMVRKKVGFGQVIKMIDDLVVELKKEQQVDNSNEDFAANGQPGSVFLFGDVHQVGMQRLEQLEQRKSISFFKH